METGIKETHSIFLPKNMFTNWTEVVATIFHTCAKKVEPIVAVVQSFSHVLLFATPWTAAHQASLSITNPQSLLKLMPFESVMPSKHLVLSQPLLLPSIFPSIRIFFPVSWLFTLGSQSIGASASASVFLMNIQGLFPLGLTAFISLQSKGFSKVFSNTTLLKHQVFGTQPSL